MRLIQSVGLLAIVVVNSAVNGQTLRVEDDGTVIGCSRPVTVAETNAFAPQGACVRVQNTQPDFVVAVGQLAQTQSLITISSQLGTISTTINSLVQKQTDLGSKIDTWMVRAEDGLRKSIDEKFQKLPADLLANQQFKNALDQLKKDILDSIPKPH